MFKRVTPNIPQLFLRDKLALTALSKCGYLNKEHFKECNITDGRLNNYIKDGLVQKVTAETPGDYAYKLTSLGREIATQQYGINRFYQAQSPSHDLALGNKYFSMSEAERATWKTEVECRDAFHEKLQELRDQGEETVADMYLDMLNKGLISMPDCIYSNDQGSEISFEVITNNYGQAELMAKEAFVQVMGTEYETTRV